MANMRDIAKAAGVSVSTVSAALNGKKYVSSDLQSRILEAAKATGYAPEKNKARRIAEPREVAVVLPGVYSSYFSPLLSGFTDAAAELGYALLLFDSLRDFERECSILKTLEQRRISSLILDSVCPTDKEDAFFDRIARTFVGGQKTCVVALSRPIKNDAIYSIHVDHRSAAYEATAHLIAMGHRRIVHIRGAEIFPHSAYREEGYRQALADHGVTIDEHLIFSGDFSPISGYSAMMEFFAKGLNATAVFAANDQMAIGAIKAISQQGLRIPEDIAVVGFDNLSVSSLVSPGLTTVQYPIYQMGYLAMSTIEKRQHGQASPLCTRLNARLIVRRSTDLSQADDWNLQKW